MPYILGLLIMGVLLWLVLKPSDPAIDSRVIGPRWDDDEPAGWPEPEPEPEPLYKVGDRVILRYNWWSWKGECTPEWHPWYGGEQPQPREVREEHRAEVWAEVAHNPWSKDALHLIFAEGNLSVPLSACDGSARITYYEAPDPQWIIKSQWAREWIGVASD